MPEPLDRYQDALRRLGTDPVPLAAQAAALCDASDAGFAAAVRAFQAAADATTYAWDSDYGALLLEAAAERCADLTRKRDLLAAAVGRAERFASWATAGGEGLARMIDTKRLTDALTRVAREIEGEALPSHEFDAYAAMRDAGRGAREAAARARSDGLDRVDALRMLRDVYALSLDEAVTLLR
jgi:hypothetical protein